MNGNENINDNTNDNTYDRINGAGQTPPDVAANTGPGGGGSLDTEKQPVCGGVTGGASNEGALPGSGDGPAPGFLETIYGVLFEPVKTMKRVARRPPLVFALIMVTVLALAGMSMWLLTVSRALSHAAGPFAMGNLSSSAHPLMALGAVIIFLWSYIKWFGYSAFISLVAEMLGGTGRAGGVAAVCGLSSIPAILMVPVQLLNYYLASAAFLLIAGIFIWIWVIALMVIGVREVHGLTTGRSLLAVLSPVLVMLVFAGLLLAGLIAVAVSMYSVMNLLPGYF